MNNQTLDHFEKRECDLISLRKRSKPLNNCVRIANKSRIINFKGFIFALLFSIAIISLNGCADNPTKVALKTNDADKGITAVNKLSI